MVEFLIHNTLGAWWAGKKLAARDTASVKSEEELRAMLALPGVTWDYLRFVRSSPSPSMGEGRSGGDGPWRPAAGTFDGWPKYAKGIKGLDPCTGSGHFLVALVHHLVPIRIIEEGLSTREAVDAVLRDNIHGLEIDERCCQIAAFALALAAWTYPEAGGYRPLPELHIACTGIGPQATEEQWVELAEQSGMPTQMDDRERVKNGLLNLHRLFSQSPTLGSLINPKHLNSGVFEADYETIQPYLAAVLKAETDDNEMRERVVAAQGMAKVAELIAREYNLVLTNVPYLLRKKQDAVLQSFVDNHAKDTKMDLATFFLQRCLDYCDEFGTVASVTPQNWLFLHSYRHMRTRLLKAKSWNWIARLGPKSFRTPMWDFNILLSILSSNIPITSHEVAVLDVSKANDAESKAQGLKNITVTAVNQEAQLDNPDSRFTFDISISHNLLNQHADCYAGIQNGDTPRFQRFFWEILKQDDWWHFQQATVSDTMLYGGRNLVIFFDRSGGHLREDAAIRRKKLHDSDQRGNQAWGKEGVVVSQMSQLKVTLYTGDLYDQSCAVIHPKNHLNLPAIWAFCSSPDFNTFVRRIDQKLNVTNSTLVKVPFDLTYWQKVALEKYPIGLPEAESDDPTQWLFHGYPYEAKEEVMLQVAVARLLGYRWPAEQDDKMRLSTRAQALVKQCGKLAKFADEDGIVCIPAVRGEDPAAERLLRLLTACDVEPGVDLDNWLRNSFFEEHCKLFHDRPFVWHIWDGRKSDGFHALVNYHKLCEGNGKGRRLLESLTYAYLGEWITRQTDGVKRGEEGAEDRLAAALELQKRLEAILTGEPPFDIFVRWKPLHEQSIGWEPDINDGVRLNIRPFLASDLPGGRSGAGILRYKSNIKWTKDRGKEPMRPKAECPWFWGWDEKTIDFIGGKTFDGNRWNDCHYTNKTKQAARKVAKKGF